jgi:peptidoglycan hydrolase-like protein with peptidoglycan-binding domain
MNPKLTEDGWKAIASKFKVKDKDLQRALSVYETIDEDEHEDQLKELANISKLAANLRKDKEVAAAPVVSKYLADVLSAVQAEQREVAKAKAVAAKTEAVKKTGADEEEDEDEDEDSDYADLLMAAFKKLKGSKDVAYEFIVCDAKPHCAVMIAKKITPKHKEQLTKTTGGSKRFLPMGTCRVEDGKFTFDMEQPISGLARKLQDSIKNFTGKKLPIIVGTEATEGEEEPLLNAKNPDAKSSGGASPAGEAGAGSQASPSAPKAAPAAAPAAGGSGAFSISASVGRGGKNKPEDVLAVQSALNNRAKAGLTADGKCGPKTIDAIMAFQKTLGQFKPDGLVEPGRGTSRALAGAGKAGPPPAPPQPVAPPKLGKPALAKAPEVWHSTRDVLDKNISELKKAVRAQYANEHPDLLKEIDENMEKLDAIMDKLDHKLADSLTKAQAAADEAARKAELKTSKTILADYIKYVKSEPLIAHIDANPFGVATNLKKVLTDSLTHMAQSIG